MHKTYWDGKRKRHASDGGYCVNLCQDKAERRAKYSTLRALGVSKVWADRLRDWRIPNCTKWVKNNVSQDVDFALLVVERMAWDQAHKGEV